MLDSEFECPRGENKKVTTATCIEILTVGFEFVKYLSFPAKVHILFHFSKYQA